MNANDARTIKISTRNTSLDDGPDAFVRHPALRRLLHCWLGWSVDGRVPRRRDIDPLLVKDLIPYLQLLDVGATPDDLRYRLVGNEISATFGFEPRGKTRREIRAARISPDKYGDFDRTSRETHEIATRGMVAYTHDYMTSYNRDYREYARLLLPVSEEGDRITGVFGALLMSSGKGQFWQDFMELHVEVPIERLGIRTNQSIRSAAG